MGTFRRVEVRVRAAAFSRHRASVRRGWLALPVSKFPSTGTDAEQLPPLALTRLTPSLSKAIRFRSLPSLYCRPKPTVGLGFLSWSSSKIAPSPTSLCASTLGCPRFGVATPERVPPLSFFPTPTVVSAHSFAGLLHPAASHGVRAVSCRSAGLRRLPDIPPCVPFPFEALPDSSGWPVSRLPASSPLVHTEPKFCAPRPRGLVPVSRPAPAVLPRLMHRASMGFPRPRLSPERPPF
jgi:hypothetical protein